jgi:hypothetical protein
MREKREERVIEKDGGCREIFAWSNLQRYDVICAERERMRITKGVQQANFTSLRSKMF